MNPIKKLILYPLVITGTIILVASLNWLLTAFFALMFDVTISVAAKSPLILLYILSTIATAYLSICICQHIDEK